jgi:hypothetical protein
MDIPSLFMIPSAVSSGKVHSVFPNSTDADFDFNRDSDATRVNSEGLIERVGYYGSELASQPINLTNDFIANSGGVIVDADTFTTSGSSLDGIKSNTSVFSLTVGKTYKIDIQGNTTSSGFTLGNISASGNEYGSGFGVHTFVSQNTQLWIRQNTEGTTNITSLSVVEVTGDRARLNYEIEGGLVNTKPSLLLEPQSTNIVTYSEDFSQSYWTKSNTTINVNQSTSPDGTLNADSIVSSTANSAHYLRHTFVAVSANTPHTYSFFIKANGYTKFGVRDNAQTGAYLTYDLETESIINSASMTVVVNKLKDDWFKCSFTSTIGSNGVAGYAFYLLDDSYTTGYLNTYSYTGDGVSGFYIYGFQLEQQSYATSYIPTNGSTQTRAAETCNGAGTSSILPSEEGIFYLETASLSSSLSSSQRLTISDSSTASEVRLQYETVTNKVRFVARVSSSNSISSGVTITNTATFNKYALRWKANDFKLYINGVEEIVDTSGSSFSVGTLSQIQFAGGSTTGNRFFGKIRDIRVYNTKEMTDSEVDILLTKITS